MIYYSTYNNIKKINAILRLLIWPKKKLWEDSKHAVNSNRFFDKLLSDLINQFNFKQRDSKRGVNADSFMF